MNRKASVVAILAAVLIGTSLLLTGDVLAKRGGEGGRGDGPIVFVMGQELYYDSIVAADPLPPRGPFQQLFPPDDDDSRLRTQYGPGDREYVGGRWWVDVDGDGEISEGDHLFLCPLLPPGREAP